MHTASAAKTTQGFIMTTNTTTISLSYSIVSTSRNGGKIRYNVGGLGKAAALGELYVDGQTLVRQYGGIPTELTITVSIDEASMLLPTEFVTLCVDTQQQLEAAGVKFPAVEAGKSALEAFGIEQAGRPAARQAKEAPAALVVRRAGVTTPVQEAPVLARKATKATLVPMEAPEAQKPVRRVTKTSTPPSGNTLPIAAQGSDRMDALESSVTLLSSQLSQLVSALSGAPTTATTKVRK